MINFRITFLIIAVAATHASATVTTTFIQIDPGGTLPGYVSNTWDVTTGSDRWLSAALLVRLNGGEVYQDPAGSDAPPNPSLFGVNPTLEYDSYLTGGTDSASPSTTGPLPTVIGGAVDIGGSIPATFGTSLIDATWVSSLATKPSGNLMLGRITLSDDAQGTYGYRIGVDNNTPTTFVGGFVVDGAMTEPILTTTLSQSDPGGTLPGYVSNTWTINTLGDDWLSAELLVDLSSGDIYQDPAGSDSPPDPTMFGSNPTLEFDSYLTGGSDSAPPSTTGPSPTLVGGAVDIGGGIPMTFDTEKVDAFWGPSGATNPSGNLTLSRLTLSDDAQGTFKFRVGLDNSGAAFFLGGVIADGQMTLVGTLTAGTPGDYNDDGSVDAADYTVWRDMLGSTETLPNDDIGGMIGAAHYSQWKDNFGGSSAAGSLAAAAVPEPAACNLTIVLWALIPVCRWRRLRG